MCDYYELIAKSFSSWEQHAEHVSDRDLHWYNIPSQLGDHKLPSNL